MMSEYLENLLRSTQAASVTELFLWVLIGIFIFSIFCAVMCKGSRFTAYTPNLLTSIGILGTFVGIVIGLLAFDPADIDNSISLLLDGLKTAFITSLAGMGLSIIYKIFASSEKFVGSFRYG
ncbi:MAG: MotA/TolQ/ExbB proton channel family protein [gamma proteobacterium endosymbiont of Lamellibrachia anaximandri]|nr:MotA/TolQ/ExbB proton channel family protein [gamma proteobacterium endosymbiont of Lamellibrachia anaximandri]